jgi:hypothetical protein
VKRAPCCPRQSFVFAIDRGREDEWRRHH